ncbi:transketolase [Candidatus Daviesbacteria bacterium RIFCSPLOWO2_01_FULL_43_38]|uniref:Transketolase n=3 Tax=Candidatus Daviesiibacteriota TaxID=1752718 RepID=A0A1F5K758_9BACT|nr:MAG: Transketolase domain protein [Candidatus Daviesbacteria bacterium GW2011_GWA1_42_6]KKS70847.1 MAG: Transketolase domain protein [Candidatus Daviesbacteria bacterium GW2011_GWA2_42_7]OGE20639.1 MAG: transketolase [Candidatus Daviesbacteria bacterium RIFCSPHIGHO2_01_FULL_43_17]OGE36783.1 MAG: transketolase [Candidatus Daviesbacteria bacterium RIFCSPHIGHO2_12_FULL_43_11]OGE63701.1 MAG: transketolase [Candidatus Daviesbacteria bacterium RIFCSPLOWO2_01_FULL_43_38]
MALSAQDIQNLEEKANVIRQDIIKMLLQAGSGHSAGPLGMADVLTALYFQILKHNPKKPDWKDRDRLVLSNGHICPVLYVSLAHAGYFPVSELQTLRKLRSRLQGHPHRESLPGLEITSGPLGSGLSQACGMALVGLMDESSWRVICLMSDGEQDEGNTWEAVMFAGKNKLHNLTALIDRNNIQIDGFTEDVMPLEPLKEKYEAFGWHVLEIDGHNFESIIGVFSEAKAIFEKPVLIIAHTIPGKGVDFMENDFKWHGVPPGITDIPGEPPKNEQAKIALQELRTLQGKIKSEHE